MQKAPIFETFDMPEFSNIDCGIVKWPLSVIRLQSDDRTQLIDAACKILDTWVRYDDPSAGIVSGFAEAPKDGTAGDAACAHSAHPGAAVPKVHNTITPMLRKQDKEYQFDLALRCNITSAEHPLGVFHPHEELHHIKKENIGLIEVMGLAILPPRVRQTMVERNLSRDDVGRLFAQVLACAGVFKWDDAGRAAQRRFLDAL